MRLTVEDVGRAVAAGQGMTRHAPTRNAAFSGVSTDTRTLQKGDLFVALVSPNADGHDFVAQALRSGAAGLVVSRGVDVPSGLPVFHVLDTQIAYGRIARAWRDKFDIPVVGVTGSVGKTTVKEMLAAALSPLGPVLKTVASQNNETGVPKALLLLNETHKAAVIEMGMRGAGQIAYLCGIAHPTVGVITLIGENHIELLGSQDAIADAKGELLEALPPTGTAVLLDADPYLPRLRAKTAAQVVTFGMAPRSEAAPPAPSSGGAGVPLLLPLSRDGDTDSLAPPVLGAGGAAYRAEDIIRADDGWRFTLRGVSVEINSPSRHDIANASAALAAADTLGVPLAEAAAALRAYAPPPMRMQMVPTPWGGVVLDDAYNAAPASVRSALETLAARPDGRKLAFLGDMKELGERGETAHRELGGVIAALGGLDAVYAVGPLAANILGATATFADSAAAARFAEGALDAQPGDTVLVKGSRAMAMERIVDALRARQSPEAPPAPNPGGARVPSLQLPATAEGTSPSAPPVLGAGGPPKGVDDER